MLLLKLESESSPRPVNGGGSCEVEERQEYKKKFSRREGTMNGPGIYNILGSIKG